MSRDLYSSSTDYSLARVAVGFVITEDLTRYCELAVFLAYVNLLGVKLF